jgi:hypothetical protein
MLRLVLVCLLLRSLRLDRRLLCWLLLCGRLLVRLLLHG